LPNVTPFALLSMCVYQDHRGNGILGLIPKLQSEKYSIEQWQSNYSSDVERGKTYRQMVKEAK
jgi:hypothetical protein